MIATQIREPIATLRTMKNFLRASLTILAIASGCPASGEVDQADVLAAFGTASERDASEEGWKFEWNPTGRLDEPQSYVEMEAAWSEGARGKRFAGRGVLDEKGTLITDRPSVSSGGVAFGYRDSEGALLYAISSFTLPKDSKGDVWLQNGNLQNRSSSNSVSLKIMLNDKVATEVLAEKALVPTLFQHNFGPLKKGDTLRVAVGPGSTEGTTFGGGRLRYILEDRPAGVAPEEPRNVIWQPIDARMPQYSGDTSSSTYEAKHEQLDADMLAKDSKLVFVGDSITTRWPQELLNEHFGAYRPANFGVGGDWVQNVRWRIENSNLDKVSVQVAVLLIGTNNLSNQFTEEEISTGIGLLLESLWGKSPTTKVLLLGVLPRGASMEDPINARIADLNQRLSALAAANPDRVTFLDVGPALVEPDGSISPEVMPDRLHVAMPGYERWLEVMKPVLINMLADEKPDRSE